MVSSGRLRPAANLSTKAVVELSPAASNIAQASLRPSLSSIRFAYSQVPAQAAAAGRASCKSLELVLPRGVLESLLKWMRTSLS